MVEEKGLLTADWLEQHLLLETTLAETTAVL
jgi:hypothetical protein